jgi:SOS response regulatory protein OraA/RecX
MLIRQQVNRSNGPRLIRQKLKAQGIDLSGEQLKEIASEVSDRSEVETARAFVERKYPKCWEDKKTAVRASQALLRRGFSYSIIQDVLRKVIHEDES